MDPQPIRGVIDLVDEIATGVYMALIVLSRQDEVSPPALYNPEISLSLKGIREGLNSLQKSL